MAAQLLSLWDGAKGEGGRYVLLLSSLIFLGLQLTEQKEVQKSHNETMQSYYQQMIERTSDRYTQTEADHDWKEQQAFNTEAIKLLSTHSATIAAHDKRLEAGGL